MRAAIAFVLALAGSALGLPTSPKRDGPGFTIAHPGGVQDIVLTKYNTVNGTTTNTTTPPEFGPLGTRSLPLNLVNNFSGGSINAYITGLDANNRVVIVGPNGNFIYPSSGGSTTPVLITQNIAIPMGGHGSTKQITIPDYISSGRIWFAEGTLKFYMVTGANGDSLVEPSFANPADPSANVNWGFVELTNIATGIWANISYVDFVGLTIGMTLAAGSTSQTVPGLTSNAVSSICNDLVAQSAADGQKWSGMCVANSAGQPLRVLAPIHYSETNAGAFANYWTNYVNQVWSTYTQKPLTINTQNTPGTIKCQVQGSQLICPGDNRGYNKPTATDIWGCNSGPFGTASGDNLVHLSVIPRLCAAFHRSTLLINGGDVQPSVPSSSYYTVNPTDHYSRIVHKYETNNIGYTFAYDDVNPSGGQDQSGTLHQENPTLLTLYVGGAP